MNNLLTPLKELIGIHSYIYNKARTRRKCNYCSLDETFYNNQWIGTEKAFILEYDENHRHHSNFKGSGYKTKV